MNLSNLSQYAVIGNPIEHSKSPIIHAAFAAQTMQFVKYSKVLAPLDGFSNTVHKLIAQGFNGANVTVPFKLEAFHLSDHVTKRAYEAAAVNTFIFAKGKIIGDNTDGVGLVHDIEQNLNINFANKRVLLIGAGGAAEGVLHPILSRSPALLVITNRSLEKAINMVKKVQSKKDYQLLLVSAYAFDDLLHQQFDIVINATSTGLTDTQLPLPTSIFAKSALAYDMMYKLETPFMQFARQQGVQVADGLGMLVEQAAEAFFVWRGVRPQTPQVMQMVRDL